MIEIWRCENCKFEAIDMAFYRTLSEPATCPRCNSKAIVLSEKEWTQPQAKEDISL